MRLRLVTLVLLIACVAPPPPPFAAAWSGADAHTIVVLAGIGLDDGMQDAFYNGPAGTELDVHVESYTVAGDVAGRLAVEDTTTAYDSTSGRDRLPVRAALSDEWVVLEKPRGDDSDPQLLHCRLPLPQSADELARREAAFLRHSGRQMQQRLEGWWHALARRRSSGCLYGDVGKGVSGAPQYFELCPLEGAYRVDAHALINHLDLREHVNSTPKYNFSFWDILDMPGATPPTAGGPVSAAEKVELEAWMRNLHRSRLTRLQAHADPALASVLQMVGAFHPTLTKARWNREMGAWELVMPSRRRCSLHFSTVGKDDKHNKTSEEDVEDGDDEGPISRYGARWTTVVRLRCSQKASVEAAKARGRVDGDVSYWAVNELRQLCRYDVELSTPLVCGWDQELDSLRVNPIPCVTLN